MRKETLYALIEQWALQTPECPAIHAPDRSVTYRDFVKEVNYLAHVLRQRGVKPETNVAVLMDRTSTLATALLAPTLCGGAYLPIEAKQPIKRIQAILQAADSPLLLTDNKNARRLRYPKTLVVDDLPFATQAKGTELRRARQEDRAPVYVMFTSGSTGMPKGVVIEQRGLTNYLRWAASTYGVLSSPINSLVHTSIAGDLTVTSLWLPLTTGGCVEFLADEELLTWNHIRSRRRQALLLKLTPSHVDLLTSIATEEVLDPLVAVIGGEQLHYEQVTRFRAAAPRAVIFNEYGPTETVVGSLCYQIPNNTDGRFGPVPIGKPIAETFVKLRSDGAVDDHGRPIGELLIGGRGVARGYIGAAGNERFIVDYDERGKQTRWYVTGDQAALNPNGDYEYVGRLDDQVKIRGYRVDLGEIDWALRNHPSVHSAAAVLVDYPDSGSRLVAFVVIAASKVLDQDALREHLGQLLPAYMIPHRYVAMDALPTTAIGKVDRKALARMAHSKVPRGGNGTALKERAALTTYRRLEEIWQEALTVEKIDATDNFFTLGGDSLLAIEVTATVGEAFGIRIDHLSPELLFKAETFRDFVASVEQVMARTEQKSTRHHPRSSRFGV